MMGLYSAVGSRQPQSAAAMNGTQGRSARPPGERERSPAAEEADVSSAAVGYSASSSCASSDDH